MIIGSVISEELRWQDFVTDGRTGFAFGDAGKKNLIEVEKSCQKNEHLIYGSSNIYYLEVMTNVYF